MAIEDIAKSCHAHSVESNRLVVDAWGYQKIVEDSREEGKTGHVVGALWGR